MEEFEVSETKYLPYRPIFDVVTTYSNKAPGVSYVNSKTG